MAKPGYPPLGGEDAGKSPTVSFALPVALLEAVDAAAEAAGETRSEWLRRVIGRASKKYQKDS